ncbi:MAG: hypothetical protein GX288_03130 [Clostridiales bacterium]|nr:hypothetical protein [Clostridiales bacterium]
MDNTMTKGKEIIIILLAIILWALPWAAAYGYTDYTKESNYVYDQYGMAIKIPTAYEYKSSISLKNVGESLGIDITSPADMFVKKSGQVFIAEASLGAIIMFDSELKFQKILTEFITDQGEVLKLSEPQGLYVSEDDVLYIADTGNSRIVVSDLEGNVSMIVEKPDSILGTDLRSFLPIKVVVDSAGRISVVARNINSGIMQFTRDGVFTGYTGAPSVSIDAFTKLLRKFSTAQQRAQMQTFVPTEYNNIKIDDKNFIWGTISSISIQDLSNVVMNRDLSGKVTPIKKLNTMGVDVLRRKGLFPPIGELSFIDDPSKIIDVGLGPNKIYSLLDSYKGRIFTYNNDGILLYVFGNKGSKKGNTQIPIAIDYIGNNILVLDSGLCEIIIYEPTSYGRLLIEAEGYYDAGDYTLANEMWKEVAERNSNFQYAYIGLGNAQYSIEEYEEAMAYYEYANDPNNYSKAKEKLRKDTFEQLFPIIFTTLLVVIAIYLGWNIFVKVRRYARGEHLVGREEEED